MWKSTSWQVRVWHPVNWWGGDALIGKGKPIRRRGVLIFPKPPELEILETIEAQYDSLVDKQFLLRGSLKRLGKSEDLRQYRAQLQADLKSLNGQIKSISVRLGKQQQQADLALKRYQDEEEQIERSIITFILDLLEE